MSLSRKRNMLTPTLTKENPPPPTRGNKSTPIDWPKTLKKITRSKSYYKVNHEFPSATAASSIASDIRSGRKKLDGVYDAVARGRFVWVRNLAA